MNCEQARELRPAYALGALEPDETRDVEAHLRAGHEHDEELVELRATVFALDRFADAQALEPGTARNASRCRSARREGPGEQTCAAGSHSPPPCGRRR